MKKTRPFLKWAGNKYRCLNKILDAFTPATRLIEPFTGSAAVFLNTDYSAYLLAEANLDLIVLFSLLRQDGEAFIGYCKSFFSEASNHSSHYYELREQFNQSNDPQFKSAVFLYLNRHGYNGLCRYNKQGSYNVPFGSHNKPYFPENEMRLFHEKAQQATFIHSDFNETFSLAREGDIIYCDPPYAPLTQQSNFSSYTGTKFGEQQQIRLAELAIKSAQQGVTVIISNHDTEFTRHHYKQAEIKSFPVKRSIHYNPLKRLAVNELIAIFRPV